MWSRVKSDEYKGMLLHHLIKTLQTNEIKYRYFHEPNLHNIFFLRPEGKLKWTA